MKHWRQSTINSVRLNGNSAASSEYAEGQATPPNDDCVKTSVKLSQWRSFTQTQRWSSNTSKGSFLAKCVKEFCSYLVKMSYLMMSTVTAVIDSCASQGVRSFSGAVAPSGGIKNTRQHVETKASLFWLHAHWFIIGPDPMWQLSKIKRTFSHQCMNLSWKHFSMWP